MITSLHVLEMARQYGRRVVALRDGRVVYDGPPRRLDPDGGGDLRGAAPA